MGRIGSNVAVTVNGMDTVGVKVGTGLGVMVSGTNVGVTVKASVGTIDGVAELAAPQPVIKALTRKTIKKL